MHNRDSTLVCLYFSGCYNLDVTKGFEIINHTADIGIIAYGKNAGDLFVNAGKGLFNLIIDPEQVTASEAYIVEVKGEDREALLVNWLNELIYLFEAKGEVFKDFQIISIRETELKARAMGEKINPEKHRFHREVKAATYHQLRIEQTVNGWRAQVIFDI